MFGTLEVQKFIDRFHSVSFDQHRLLAIEHRADGLSVLYLMRKGFGEVHHQVKITWDSNERTLVLFIDTPSLTPADEHGRSVKIVNDSVNRLPGWLISASVDDPMPSDTGTTLLCRWGMKVPSYSEADTTKIDNTLDIVRENLIRLVKEAEELGDLLYQTHRRYVTH